MDSRGMLRSDAAVPDPVSPLLQPPAPHARWRAPDATMLAASSGMVAVAACAAMGLRGITPPGSVALVFLVSVLFSAVLFGFWTGIVSAGLAFLAYNFFFVEPIMTLRVTHAEDFLALGVFVLVAGLTGTLAGRLREQANAAQERARILEHLSLLSNELGNASSEGEVRRFLRQRLADLTAGQTVCVDQNLVVEPSGGNVGIEDIQTAERAVRHQSAQHAAAQGWAGSRFNFYPLAADPAPLVVGIKASHHSPEIDKAIIAAIEQTGAVIARMRLAKEAEAARIEAERESLRSALLSSLSHDLKTPLATILGSVTTLRQFSESLPEEARADLLQVIEEDARRLSGYVGDLLHMTRLQAGLDLRLDWVDPGDVINGAMRRTRRDFPNRAFVAHVPDAHPLMRTDAALLEQALFNCLDNAARIAPDGSIVTASVSLADGCLRFTVEDEGPGVPQAEQARIFEPFQRGSGAAHHGSGLGLAIAKGIVQALGGNIGVASPLTAQGGARFTLSFPIEGTGTP